MARGRFSSRVMQHRIAPGKARPKIVALSYLNAGLRLFDISEPTEPKEVAYFVPPRDGEMDDYLSWRRGTTEAVFIEWDRNLIWLSHLPQRLIDERGNMWLVGQTGRSAGRPA